MNLNELFELQAKLDAHIEKEHPRQPGEDRLAKKILALKVELGECANEWRGFKFWSNDQKPRVSQEIECTDCNEYDTHMCCTCQGLGIIEFGHENPLLEEYVDVVHFTLSVGLEIEIKHEIFPEPINYGDVVIQFNELFGQISYFASVLNRENDWEEVESEYERIWSLLFGLAGLLGFTWEQVEQSYLQKNRINHERQENSY
mgnify:CR=1 FL=1